MGEKADELRAILESEGEYTFKRVQEMTEEIMGRPVWTHEFAGGVIQYLYDELDGVACPGMWDKIGIIRGDKPVIVVLTDGEKNDG